MKSKLFGVCYVGFLSFVFASKLDATDSGTTGFSFLNLPVGARATAMGQAFGSIPNDIQGLVYNPASLATMAASQVSFQHLSYVEDVTQEAFSFGHAGRQEEMSWGFSSNYLRVADITRTVATPSGTGDGYTEAGTFSTYDLALGLSAAGPVTDELKVGGTVKFIRESLVDASANAGAIDLGGVYRLNDEHSWNVGVAMQNFGMASKFADAAVKLPTSFRVGISGQPFSQWLLATDYLKRVDTGGEFDVGIEVTPRRFISLRMGYRYQLTRPDLGGFSDFSAGIGLRHNRMSFDYAFIPLGDLGMTHRLSVSYRFKPKAD
jgi:long-subunit fatty acid transport protein